MGVAIEVDANNVWQLQISGKLIKAEMDAVQAKAVDYISKVGTVKTLVILDGFEGWEEGVNWGDMSFFVAHGDEIDKIAIVGDPKWEDDMLMFVSAGLRKAPVRYFPEDQLDQARAWLE